MTTSCSSRSKPSRSGPCTANGGGSAISERICLSE